MCEVTGAPLRGCCGGWRAHSRALKREGVALHYSIQDPRAPLLSRLLPMLALAYALSPLSLLPNFIPVLGLVDDLLLMPALLWMSIRLIPSEVGVSGMNMESSMASVVYD